MGNRERGVSNSSSRPRTQALRGRLRPGSNLTLQPNRMTKLGPRPAPGRRSMRRLIVPLTAAEATDADRFGPKAANLARLGRAGLPIPDGFCVDAEAYRIQVVALGLEESARDVNAVEPGTARRAALAMKLGLLDHPIVSARVSGGGLSCTSDGDMVLNATWGLGSAIAQGEVVPDRIVLSRDGVLRGTVAGRIFHRVGCAHGTHPASHA